MSVGISPVGPNNNRNADAARASSNELIEKAKQLGEKAKGAWIPTKQIDLGRQAFDAVKRAAAADPSNPDAWRLYGESLSEMGLATFASAAISEVGGGKVEFAKSVETVLSKMIALGLGTERDNQLKKDLRNIQEKLK